MRTLDFRVDVLRSGIPYTQLRYSEPPSVFCDSSADICMSFKGTFLRSDAVNYVTDELRPVVILDGTEYPVGVYVITTRRESCGASGVMRDEIEAYDRTIRLSWAKLEARDYWEAGSSYDEIISHYLIAAGITRASSVPSGQVLQSAREDWDIGTSYLTIVNTLLEEINYDPIWFDATGVAHIEPYAVPSVAKIDHTYRQGDVTSLLAPDVEREVDLYDKPNVFIAVLTNPEYPEPLTCTAVNDTPASKLSTISRGMRIPRVYKVSNIASATELQAYVDRLRDDSMISSESVSITTAIHPGHGVGDTVALIHDAASGIYRELSWSFTLQAGAQMRHELQRTVMI